MPGLPAPRGDHVRADSATKYLLPVATSLAPDGKSAPTPPKPAGTFADSTPSPALYRRAAAAHMTFMQSHVVTELTCPVDPGERVTCDAADPACGFAFRARGDCEACFKASRRGPAEGHPPFNRTAFWIMDVDKRVSRDHGDIGSVDAQPDRQLMAPRGFFEPGKGPMQFD